MLRSTETYLSGVGPITVQRTLYRAGSEPAVVALELRAGIVAGHWTPLAARQASVLVAHMTPQESVDTLRELGNMSPSRSSLDRLPKHLSSRWEQDRERFEDELREATQEVPAGAATLAVSRRGDGADEGWRSAGQASGAGGGPRSGRSGSYDGDGERLGTLRMGRMPEANKRR